MAIRGGGRGGVTVLPGPVDDLAAMLAGVGHDLRTIFDPQGARRNELENITMQNPEVGARIAQALRTLEEGEGEGEEAFDFGALEAFGLDPEDPANRKFATGIAEAFPETPQEQASRAIVETGGGRVLGEAQVEQARATRAKAIVDRKLSEAREEEGTPEIQAEFERLGFQNQLARAGLESEAISQYESFISELPEEEQGFAGLAFSNPQAAQTLINLRQLDLEELMIQARNAVDPYEQAATRFALIEALDDQITQTLEDVRAAQEAGEEDTVRIMKDRLNDLAQERRNLFPGMTTFLAEEDSRWLRTNGISFRTFRPPTGAEIDAQTYNGLVTSFAQRLAQGESTEDLEREMMEQTEFWKSALPEARRKFVNDAKRMSGQFELDGEQQQTSAIDAALERLRMRAFQGDTEAQVQLRRLEAQGRIPEGSTDFLDVTTMESLERAGQEAFSLLPESVQNFFRSNESQTNKELVETILEGSDG